MLENPNYGLRGPFFPSLRLRSRSKIEIISPHPWEQRFFIIPDFSRIVVFLSWPDRPAVPNVHPHV